MELREYWRVIRRRWWLPAALTLVALVASTAVALRGAAAYKTEMRLAVSTDPTQEPAADRYYDPIYYSNVNSEYLADDLSELLTSKSFAAAVEQDLNQTVDADTIASVTRSRKTHRFIDVTIVTPTIAEGQLIATSIAHIVNDPGRMGTYLHALDAYKSQVTVVSPPATTRGNTLGGIISEVGLRTVVALIAGLALVFLLDYLDDSVHGRGDAERLLGLPVLAEIPAVRKRAAA